MTRRSLRFARTNLVGRHLHQARAMNKLAGVVRGVSSETTNLSESSGFVNSNAVAPNHEALSKLTRCGVTARLLRSRTRQCSVPS